MDLLPKAPEEVAGGRYAVERKLGEGGMGAVYEVRDLTTGQRLALKRLHREMRGPQAELFEREYRTLASLRHPRIVQVFEYGVDDGGAFYTMELLEGSDLSKRAPMPWREACACLRDAASILGVLHARRLVHRDLSPRNLWQTPDGRLKLLDFGALAPFGPARQVVGTAPFVAPEALECKPLDQRTDLFALGALGYWLLTSAHAYRATRLAELPRVWLKPPAVPSSLAKLVQRADVDLPPELDRLIDSLLRIDPDERPRTTAELVDQLNAIAGLTPEVEEVVVHGYLESSAFVGRQQERDRLAAALSEAADGKPHALLVEGPEGVGRSRLLAELALTARVSGATVVSAAATGARRPYELSVALARGLLLALPEETRNIAGEHASVLGGLSRDLHALLGDPPPPPPALDAVEERSRKQAALTYLFLAPSRRRTLAITVDDLEAADEESQAVLAALARAAAGHRLVVVGAVCTDSPRADATTLRTFRSAARALRLPPLRVDEMREMLASVFGEAPYLERVAARLHRVSDGSPSHALMLARHLVRTGIVRYAEGAWTLPSELPEDLPKTLGASVLVALEDLPPDRRELARLASVSDLGPLGRETLALLWKRPRADTDAAVTQLVEQRILRESGDGVQIAHPALRQALLNELELGERVRAQRLLADELAPSADVVSQVQSGLYSLRAFDIKPGQARLLVASRRIMLGEHEPLRAVAPIFAEAIGLLRSAHGDEYAQAPLLNVLAVAGYQVDRSYAVQYGDDAIRALQRILRFDLVRRLGTFLHPRIALLLTLLVATVALRFRRARIGTVEAVAWLVGIMGYLMGPAALCRDGATLRRYAAVFEPLLALGADHGVSVLQRFCLSLAAGTEDRFAEVRRLLQRTIDLLNRPGRIPGLLAINHRNLLAANYYAYGLRETMACDGHVLETADKLDGFSPMHAMQADQLRAYYYAYRGESARAAAYERRVELKAIQLGTAWQAEILAPEHLSRVALWTHDASANKRAARALAVLARDIPSFEFYERRARAAELILRGKYSEARTVLDVHDEPLERVGWVSMRALLARAYNGLGEHERAKAVCTDALARLPEDDRAYVVMNLAAEIELAMADGGLGAHGEADDRLERLLKAHASSGALIVGALHRARARVALLRRDFDACERHLDAMDVCYRPTRIPSLLLLTAELRDELRRAQSPELASEAHLTADDAHLLTRVELILTSDVDDHTAAALKIAQDLTGADRGFLLYAKADAPAGWLGERPSSETVDWAKERLHAAEEEDGLTAASDMEETQMDELATDANAAVFEGVHFSATLLWQLDRDAERPIAALVLGSEAGHTGVLPHAVVAVIGDRLSRAGATPSRGAEKTRIGARTRIGLRTRQDVART